MNLMFFKLLLENNRIKLGNFCFDYRKVGKGIQVLVFFVKIQLTE